MSQSYGHCGKLSDGRPASLPGAKLAGSPFPKKEQHMASLTTIAGSTANLKRDPPLTQLTDWLSNYNYPLFLFSLGVISSVPCHLTCVES
ncbi:hypothetical protein NQZ68_021650 [Dissostichus eleginoides]|nr:hypothetical protein NQZ68_021650 [Dissostichus eleginoides]